MLPVCLALVVWGVLAVAEVENAFHVSFGSGDLISVAAMMLVVVNQEIDRLPLEQRSTFLLTFYEHSLWIGVIAWFFFGATKLIVNVVIPKAKTPGHIYDLISWISIASLAVVFVFCLIARLSVWSRLK